MRNLRFGFFDEASAMISQAVNDDTIRQFDRLKSFAVQSKMVVVMGGAYDLLGMRLVNGQLLRRQDTVHFARYDVHDEDDL